MDSSRSLVLARRSAARCAPQLRLDRSEVWTQEKKSPASVDEYIAQCPPDVQPILQQVRAVIRETVPQAEERIGYGMPGYYLNGGLVWFGAHKNHIGLYPTPSGITHFEEELSPYKREKGSARFPLDQPIPYDLIRKIVEFRVAENQGKKKKK